METPACSTLALRANAPSRRRCGTPSPFRGPSSFRCTKSLGGRLPNRLICSCCVPSTGHGSWRCAQISGASVNQAPGSWRPCLATATSNRFGGFDGGLPSLMCVCGTKRPGCRKRIRGRRREMARKVWKAWKLQFAKYTVYRRCDGAIEVWREEVCVGDWSPTEARRLFQKLSSDYRD